MKRIAGCIALVAMLAGCDSTGPEVYDAPRDQTFPGISATTPVAVEHTRDTIQIRPEPQAASSAGWALQSLTASDELEYTIVQAARIPPVEVGGRTVQANDIVVNQSGNTAYIAYNYQGGPWVGALHVVDLTKKGEPEVIKQIQLEHMDVNALYLDGNTLLIAGAADPDRFPDSNEPGDVARSFVMALDVRTLDEDEMARTVVRLPSYAATGVSRHSDRYYVGVGARDGSIQALDLDFGVVGSLDRADIRDIETYDNGIIALAGTTDAPETEGHVVVATSGALDNSTAIGIAGFGSDYHKATIEMWQGTVALLGLSEAGWKVMDMRSPDSFLAQVDNPAACEAGQELEDLLCNTNSVSTDGNIIFTANGQFGFRVFRPKSKNDFADPELLGYYHPGVEAGLPLEEQYSANHVEFRAGHLFVASGARGVFVYTLESNP